MMKKFFGATLLLLLLNPLTGLSANKKQYYDAASAEISYIGRTEVRGSEVVFDWCGVYSRIRFTGGSLVLEASNSGECWFNIWIDKDSSEEPDQVLLLKGEKQSYTLYDVSRLGKAAQKAAKGQIHEAIIMRRNDSGFGLTTFHRFRLEGELLPAEPVRERLIEFIGDSYTSGDGSELSRRDDGFNSRWQNPNKTYANILARYFGADYIRVSHSGQGIARNYDDAGRGYYMADRYLCSLDSDKASRWDATRFPRPALTVIYLGTNDFSTSRQPSFDEFRRHYMRLLGEIKANYGEQHPILCVASKHDWYCHDYIQEVVRWCGLKNVYFTALFGPVHNDADELGAAWHPSYPAHKKIALALLPYIATLTGWELDENTIK